MNRLSGQASSYLRTAAHQPVHWHAWGAEAFERAGAESKPILLDVGAVWCHWCHVMDHESYEDAETAALINERFVAVKVDRDERPDVDARYQKAVQAMIGQGGWPLTAFLLPDGRCFYGGTYFPPQDAHGRPSFKRVLTAVSDAFRDRREEILQNADHLAAHVERAAAPSDTAEAEWEQVLVEAVAEMRAQFDVEHGGFGRAPKFPHPASHDFLLARADAAGRDVARETLRAMRDGGVYDQIAGGFHRYSVDAEWIVPHFEKMLYDNAGLLRNYVRASVVFGDESFHKTAREIVAFLRDTLQQPEGGFGGSQDADVGAEAKARWISRGTDATRQGASSAQDDGDHFTWTLAELHEAIPDANLAKLMAMHYHVREVGDMHHDRSRCVLRVEADAETLAAALKLDPVWVQSELERGRGLMREARAKRPPPFVDPVRYTSWNAMAIQALLEHGGAFGSKEADEMALRALDLFLSRAFDADKGWARALGLATRGILDDNAQMLDALLEGHLATGDARYLDAARTTAETVLRHFQHPRGGFADRAPDLAPKAEAQPLATPERPIQDAPTASPNGVVIRALLRLSEATGDARYRDAATAALRALAHDAAHLNLFGGALLLAMHEALHPAPRVVVRAKDTAPYRAATRRVGTPGATFAAPDDPGVPEEARLFPGEGAIVCVGTRCLAPARSPGELLQRLAEARNA